LELCKALRGSGEFKKLKIVVISEFLGQNAKEAFLEIGVDGFVPKPFDLKAFNEVVTPIVESAKDPEGVVKKGMDISKADFVEKIKAETPNVELNPQELTITFNEMSVTVPVDKILEVGKITPKGLKIGIMGCIVNGPGEMADADYGYVGAGRGKISLYKKKECIEKNIPEEEAVEKLIELIRKNGDYTER
jgi:CheY-like chemotaxis protein